MTTKGITQPTVGSLNWDVPLNANFAAIEKAFGNSVNITATTGSYNLSVAEVGNMTLRCTGALTADLTIKVPSGTAGQWVVSNSTTDATGGPWKLYVSSLAGGPTVEIKRTEARSVYTDGTANGIIFADNVATPGATTQVIYNNAGTLTGSSNLTTDGSALTAGSVVSTSSVSAETAAGNWIATQSEAEIGSNNDQIMTPVRVLQAILFRLNSAGTAPMYACRAWAKFNGLPAGGTYGNGNISNIVRNSTGSYTVTFASALQDANYTVVVTAGGSSSNPTNAACTFWTNSYGVSSFNIFVSDNNTDALRDVDYINFAVFR